MSQPGALDRLSPLLPPGSLPSATPIVPDLYSLIMGSNGQSSTIRRYNLLYVGSARLARTMDVGEAFRTLGEHLHVLLAVRAPRTLFVRAAVVGWRDRAVIIPNDDPADVAPLVSALVRVGATYYSNRYAVVDPRGCVHAYPTPLVDETTSGAPAANTSPATRGSHGNPRPVPVGVVLFRRRESDMSSRLRELSPAQTVLGLLGHTAASRLRPGFALEILTRSLSGAVGIETRRDESDDEIVRLLDRYDHLPSPARVSQQGGSHAPAPKTRQFARARGRSRAPRL